MNNCILMVEIVQPPQLRYTADNQTPIAEMLVKFSNLRDDSFAVLKVVGWGNLAQEINEKYHQGDHVIVEGRLGMNVIERPEGFKEKRAEMTARRVYMLDIPTTHSSSDFSDQEMSEAASTPNNVVHLSSRNRTASSSEPMQPAPSEVESEPDFDSPTDPENPDYDPIPF
ncbi:single-stranded DNA-binding protein [Lyngbya sp. PCC 8106]|uniref:single-stranded DNA-binding protein n=1 Tax=Lyngbya sp. (strain PCC 8106) TaxID=313612 RepID=UPI0000EA9008|nr:single-stranded DNA-binding protein [Lyngbya sp. PCC 8106]EAW34541.1 Single-strand binding protein [Lyngbya sp. PCC 8106]